MYSTEFQSEKGQCLIEMDDDGQDITVKIDGEEGTLSLKMGLEPYHFRITNLSLDNMRRMGIGRRCLQFHKEIFAAPITAASPYGQHQLADGSHLTGDGLPFISQMRDERLVCKHQDELNED